MNSELPDDIEQLKALLRKQQSQLRQSASQNPHAVNPHENRCRQNFPGRRIAFCLLRGLKPNGAETYAKKLTI